MEDWQKIHVTKFKEKLIESIACETPLLTILQSKGLLSKIDVDQMKSSVPEPRKPGKVALLLDILPTQKSGFEILLNALYQTKQTEAVDILLQAYQENYIDAPILKFGNFLHIQELLSQKVEFQGVSCTLQQACTNISAADLQDILHANLDEDTHSKLMSSSLKLVEDTIPPPLPYYINRSLSIKNRIDPKAFTELEEDIFLIQNIEQSQLTQLAWNASDQRKQQQPEEDFPDVLDLSTQRVLTDVSGNQLGEITCRFILLEDEEDYHVMTLFTEKSVHWIQFRDDNYILITSNDGYAGIAKYITAEEEVVTQADFLKSIIRPHSPSLFYISDSPGTGKSVLLADIARNIKKNFPERIVLFLNLPKFITLCTEIDDLEDYDKIEDAVVAMVSNNRLGQVILKKLMLTSPYKAELLFDGFDEVQPEMIETARSVLNAILEESLNTRGYVTTRPHKWEKFQQPLAYKIQPFQPADQINFLVRFWQQNLDNFKKVNEEQLTKFAKLCLSNLKIGHEEREITGIPLICRLLAEVHLTNIRSSSSKSKVIISNPISSIFEACHRYVDHCFSKIEGNKDRSVAVNLHTREAIKFIFPRFLSNEPLKLKSQICEGKIMKKSGGMRRALRPCFPKLFSGANKDPISEDELFKIGLVEAKPIEEDLQFVHRTIAEYLVAEFLASCLTNPKYIRSQFNVISADNVTSLVFKTALESVKTQNVEYKPEVTFYNFSYPTIAHFLNKHLCNQTISKNSPDFQLGFAQSSDFITARMFWKIIRCTLYHDLHVVYRFTKLLYLTHNSVEHLRSTQLPWKDLVQNGAKYSSLDLFQDCCELVQKIEGKQVQEMEFEEIFSKPYQNSPLHICISSGHLKKFEYLQNGYKDKIPTLKGLLHACLHKSYNDSDNVINNKIQIIKNLAGIHKPCLDEKDEMDSSPPLCLHGSHPKLLECLVSEGADVFATNKLWKNVAHCAASYLNEDEIHKFVELIIATNKTDVFSSKDNLDRTPVHGLMMVCHAGDKTLRLLAQASAGFNNEDVNGDTEFFAAIVGGKGKNILECMIELGADWKWRNKKKGTALHVACANGNEQAIRFLISKGANSNEPNWVQCAPLHQVAMSTAQNKCQIAKILIENGADIHAIDGAGNTPLEYALKVRNVDPFLVKLLCGGEGMDKVVMEQLVRDSHHPFLMTLIEVLNC